MHTGLFAWSKNAGKYLEMPVYSQNQSRWYQSTVLKNYGCWPWACADEWTSQQAGFLSGKHVSLEMSFWALDKTTISACAQLHRMHLTLKRKRRSEKMKVFHFRVARSNPPLTIMLNCSYSYKCVIQSHLATELSVCFLHKSRSLVVAGHITHQLYLCKRNLANIFLTNMFLIFVKY